MSKINCKNPNNKKNTIQVYNDIIGLTMTSVVSDGYEVNFQSSCGKKFWLGHSQDCCEIVNIEDICGDLEDLVGSPIIQAEEVSSNNTKFSNNNDDDLLWTFYKFATNKGSVTIRFVANLDTYYSTKVSFEEMM